MGIQLWSSKMETIEVPNVKEEEDEDDDEDEEIDAEDEEDSEDDEPETKTEERTVWFWKQLNEQKPIWTRRPSQIEDKQHIWKSTADGAFSIAEDPRGVTLGRGTSVILSMKEDASEFVENDELERVIKRYSQFMQYPI